MLLWLLAAALGAAAAAIQYGRSSAERRTFPLALLRAFAVMIVVALFLDAAIGRAVARRMDVALDASASWTRATRRCDAFRTAHDSARRINGGHIVLFGDSLREERIASAPADRASNLRALADRAAGTGRPVVVITDGELDDAELLSTLPSGSRVIAMPCAGAPDVAVASMEVPRVLLAGDTILVRVTLVAGAVGGPIGRLELRLDNAVIGTEEIPALPPYMERTYDLHGVVAGKSRGAVLRTIYRSDEDAEPRNDTLSLGVDVTQAPAAVFVSTAPDYDAREAVAVLRGVTSLPTRAYYRIAPGVWRADGTLSSVDEATVRSAVQDAPLVVLHGDTAVFGPPRAATRAALLLFAPPAIDDGEWFAAAVPSSPLAEGLAGMALDSLSPLSVAGVGLRARWTALTARRGGASQERRAVLVGWDEPRRVAVLGAVGFWRWRFRGGVRADAYSALFGTLFDWLIAARSDRRAAVVDATPIRAGSPVRWRRGALADTVTVVTLRRRNATAPVQSITLHFPDAADVAESPPLDPGIYDATLAGGTVVLAVNVSRELIPRRPTARSGPIGDGAPDVRDAPRARDVGWIYALAVALLCTEWVLRKRVGLP